MAIKSPQGSEEEDSSVLEQETVNEVPRLLDVTMPRYCQILVVLSTYLFILHVDLSPMMWLLTPAFRATVEKMARGFWS